MIFETIEIIHIYQFFLYTLMELLDTPKATVSKFKFDFLTLKKPNTILKTEQYKHNNLSLNLRPGGTIFKIPASERPFDKMGSRSFAVRILYYNPRYK